MGEYGHAIRHPELFHIATVGQERAKELRASGFKVTPTRRAVIPLHEYSAARIEKGSVVFTGSGGLESRTILAGAKDFHRKLREISKRDLPRNTLITARIGDNHTFNSARFGNYGDLYHYVTNVFQPKDKGADRNKLIGLMSVVTVPKAPPKSKKKIAAENAAKKARKAARAKLKRRSGN